MSAGRRRVRIAAVVATALTVLAVLALWYGWRTPFRGGGTSSGVFEGRTPARGALPFDGVERSTYRVTWRVVEGGGMTAGRATFGAQPDGPSRHFTLDVETSAWLSTLYNVRGRIESWAGAGLRPSRQEQHLREGARVTDQTTRFDDAARTFTAGDGPPAPLPPEARDGLTAWFHVRTLPLAPGFTVRVPVVESSRVYSVAARVDRVERIPSGGRDVEAFRLDLRVESAADGREIARAVAWISTDRRRVPLVLDLEVSVGSFRAELDAYDRR